MTPEERQKAFTEAYNALVQQCGVVLEAQLQAEQLGTAILTKPVLAVALVNNWQPAEVPVGHQDTSYGIVDKNEMITTPNGHKEKV